MRAWVLVAVFVIACDAPDPERSPPEAPGTVTPEAPAEVAPEPEPEAPAGPATARVVDLPDGEVVLLQGLPAGPRRRIPIPEDGWGEDGSYGTVREVEGEPGLAARLNAHIEALAKDGYDAEDVEAYPANCTIGLAHPKLLAVRCAKTMVYERGGSELIVTAEHVAVGPDELEPFDLVDTISPTVGFDAMVRRACARGLRREGFEPAEAERDCRGGEALQRLHLTRRGLAGEMPVYDEYGHEEITARFTIPFAELDRGVLADSPLGAVLAEVPEATIVEVELPPGTLAPGEEAAGTAYGVPAIAQEAIGRFLSLPAAAREDLVIAGSGREYRLARPESAGAGDAALGEGTASTWHAALQPRVVRTRVETSFRTRPNANRTLILPKGTVLAVALGRLHGRESAMGERGTWAVTAAAPGVFGYTAGALLEPFEGCEPPPEPFLDAIPEARRGKARTSLVRAALEVRRGGQPTPVFVYGAALVGASRSRPGRSRVEIHAVGEGCALDRRLVRHDSEGNLFAVRFAKTHRHGGQTLVLIGSYVQSRMRWELFPLGSTEALWTHTHRRSTEDIEVKTEVREGDTYYPLVVEEEGEPVIELAWTEDGIEVL